MTPRITLTDNELTAIIQLIHQQYGYDFSDYARASLGRRVRSCMEQAGLNTVYELRYYLTNDKSFFDWFLQTLTVNVTEMFRDPTFYQNLREKVLPNLATYPVIKIWHAGCATGEEVFSMAILLAEAGLLERSRLYATDINPANLHQARQGIIPIQQMKTYTENYRQSGGKTAFSTYYTAQYEHAIIGKDYRKNIVLAQHNLAIDQVFNEFQLICCRNVLIYFNRELQNRVFQLFYDSLSPLGYLAIGLKESIQWADVGPKFDAISSANRIYRRKQ
ncbi:chemotaxis protein CheR [Spirosoma harenae]